MKSKWWLIALAICLAVACLAPLASSSPDGLERVAEDQGFIDAARDAAFQVIPDYLFPGVGSEALATILAGLIGTLILFGLIDFAFGKHYNAVGRNFVAALLDHTSASPVGSARRSRRLPAPSEVATLCREGNRSAMVSQSYPAGNVRERHGCPLFRIRPFSASCLGGVEYPRLASLRRGSTGLCPRPRRCCSGPRRPPR